MRRSAENCSPTREAIVPTSELRGRHQRSLQLAPLVALLVLALTLRAPITVVPPLLAQLRADLGLSPTLAGLLTSVPVLCFGLLTPAASGLIRAVGINLGAVYCLAAVILGSVIRSSAGTVAAFVGTTAIGIGITIGNLVVPMMIGRQFHDRIEVVTGAYSATVNIASTAATALAVPIAAVLGWRWTLAAVGTMLGLVALACWLAVYPPGINHTRQSPRGRALLDHHPEPTRVRVPTAPMPPQRRLMTLITVAFCGHTLSYYAVTAWLPSALNDMLGMSPAQAGLGASVFQAAGIVGPLLVPLLLTWGCTQQRLVMIIGAAWLTMPAGMILAPQLWPAWATISGLAQGAFFTVLVTVVIRRARDVDENRRMTSLMQTVGYSVAATGPVAAGWAHQAFSGWTPPFALILIAIVLMITAAVLAVRTPGPA